MIFFALLVAILALFAALTWRNPRAAILTLLALTPTYLVRFSAGLVPTTLLECLVMIVVVGAGVRAASRWRRDRESRTSPSPSFVRRGNALMQTRMMLTYLIPILLGIATVIGVIIADDKLAALNIAKSYIVEPMLLGMVMLRTFKKEDYVRGVMVLATSGAVIGALAIAQVLFHVGIPDAWAIENRATSIFPYPNAVGLLLAPIVSATIVLLALQTTPSPSLKRRGIATGILTLLMLAGIIAAETEAALVAIPAVFFVIAMMSTMAKRAKAGIAAASILLAISVGAIFPSTLNKVLLYDSSGLVRRSQWSETLHMLADRPLFGAGLNNYPAALEPYHTATDYEIFQYPHNVFLNIWSELGLIGLTSFILLIALCTARAWTHRSDPVILACFAALLTMLIHGLVDVPFMKNDLAVVSVFFVVGVVGSVKCKAVKTVNRDYPR